MVDGVIRKGAIVIRPGKAVIRSLVVVIRDQALLIRRLTALSVQAYKKVPLFRDLVIRGSGSGMVLFILVLITNQACFVIPKNKTSVPAHFINNFLEVGVGFVAHQLSGIIFGFFAVGCGK